MNHSLTERVTRLLAFMLRHQPEQFDLEVDAFGFADIEDVLDALSERVDEDLEVEDLEQAIEEGSRPRYEIVKDRIRALYGHSIAVEPGEPAQPPELLYVGLPSREAERAAEHGLRSGRRRFLHLALTAEDAMETGRRSAVEYNVLTIYALDGWEDGINFYDRKSLFLAEEIPINLLEVGPVHTDGRDPAERDSRGRGGRGGRGGNRDGGRGGSRGRGGESRDRGRGGRSSAPREERAPREDRAEEPVREQPARKEESRDRSNSRDRGRSNRDSDGDRGKPRERRPSRAPRERAPRDEAPKRTSDTIDAAPKAAPKSAPEKAPAKPSTGFGLGVFEEKKPAKPKRAPAKPKRAPVEKEEAKPAKAAKPAEPSPADPPSSFGAGL